MENCENIKSCPIYANFRTESLKNIYIRKFCEGNFKSCQRWIKKSNGEKVPEGLLPDGREFTKSHINK